MLPIAQAAESGPRCQLRMPAATLDYFVGECSSPQTDAAKHNFPDDGKCPDMEVMI